MTSSSPWQSYWDGASKQDKRDSGIRDDAPGAFWATWLEAELAARRGPLRLVDLACGDGAVCRVAQQVASGLDLPLQVTAVDIAEAALRRVVSEIPTARAVVASAADTALASHSQDLVLSQFGLEYAGADALAEAARLMAPGGKLAIIQHRDPGPVTHESRETIDALTSVLNAGLLPAFRALFEIAGELQGGRATREDFERADRALSPCVQRVQALLREKGAGIAGGIVQRVYQDMGQMFAKIERYPVAEVVDWTRRAESELEAFRARMQTMLDAALDENTWRANLATLEKWGLQVERAEPLTIAGEPGAWITVAQRPG